jgi:hypothetical protein
LEGSRGIGGGERRHGTILMLSVKGYSDDMRACLLGDSLDIFLSLAINVEVTV